MYSFSRPIKNWDDPSTKESHPGKPLSKHRNEVEDIFNRYAKFYGIEKWAVNLMLPIIRHHDNGKLNPLWSIYDERRPRHSEYSIQYLDEMNLINELKDKYSSLYFPFILYLILKHHSSLYDITDSSNILLKKLCSDIIRKVVTKLNRRDRIEIVDSFGLFKLADSLSASNITDFKPIPPPIDIKLVRNILSDKRGYIDEKRWKEQQNLLSLPNASLLTAYTGWGKTDSALLFSINNQVKKVFYLFPMITALNKFYDKLNTVMNNSVEKYFYLYEYELASKSGESVDETSEYALSSFIASHFLRPVILTTVDQFLLTFLQLGKYYMKRVMFRNAVIIIDEVHLINSKMLYLLLKFINTFMSIYNLRILFMSATFSEALIQIIKDHISNVHITNLSSGYKDLLRINYELNEKTILDIDVDKIGDYLKDGKKDHKKILLVCNTVETAIRLYKTIIDSKSINSKFQSLLLHGKFMYRDRKLKEYEIDKLKDSPHILVTTQVCEVSLDVSYDLLYTEMAPIPSLIQRFGRVNRYGKRTNKINVQIYNEYRKNKYYESYPYEQQDLDLSRKVLKEIQPLASEYDLIKKFNEIENYETLARKTEEAENEIEFEKSWENIDKRTGYFFSFKLDEDGIRKKLLEFRDSITANILPDPECISDINTKKELKDLLNIWERRNTLSFEKFNHIHKTFRGYLVSVPLRLLQQQPNFRHNGLPMIYLNNLVYTSRYGFIEKEFDDT